MKPKSEKWQDFNANQAIKVFTVIFYFKHTHTHTHTHTPNLFPFLKKKPTIWNWSLCFIKSQVVNLYDLFHQPENVTCNKWKLKTLIVAEQKKFSLFKERALSTQIGIVRCNSIKICLYYMRALFLKGDLKRTREWHLPDDQGERCWQWWACAFFCLGVASVGGCEGDGEAGPWSVSHPPRRLGKATFPSNARTFINASNRRD
jgi:hypothetical protein